MTRLIGFLILAATTLSLSACYVDEGHCRGHWERERRDERGRYHRGYCR
jgi:hypothetical protein